MRSWLERLSLECTTSYWLKSRRVILTKPNNGRNDLDILILTETFCSVYKCLIHSIIRQDTKCIARIELWNQVVGFCSLSIVLCKSNAVMTSKQAIWAPYTRKCFPAFLFCLLFSRESRTTISLLESHIFWLNTNVASCDLRSRRLGGGGGGEVWTQATTYGKLAPL